MLNKIEKVLLKVQKPARYVGGEWNIIRKNWTETAIKVAFAFPDVYEIGMSHLGLQILYHIVNSRADALMERVFAPWPDMEKMMRERKIPLYSLESYRPVRDFDLFAFTLQSEMTYTNVLNMLDLAGLPLPSAERKDGEPLVIAGGPCACNPEPLADFIDLFVLGEGEEVIQELLDLYKLMSREGRSRRQFLYRAAKIAGVYVPSFYLVSYRPDGRIEAVKPTQDGIPARVRRRVVTNFDQAPFPDRVIVPGIEIVHDRVMLEVMRGCPHGCRFCQAGIIYRPVREKTPATLLSQAEKLVHSTGYDEISLISLSSADYSRIKEIASVLLDRFEKQGVNVSLPSLRVDTFSVALAQEVQRVRRAGLTFAPEAGSQRLREVINKGVTEEDLLAAVSSAFKAGWSAVKLYFMLGLPTETEEDVIEIARLTHRVLRAGIDQKVSPARLKVTVSVSSFVPKAHTVFQWEPQREITVLRQRQKRLREQLKGRNLIFRWSEPEMSFIEAVLARGDRRLGRVIEKAWREGCCFDGWSEYFLYERWSEAFQQVGLDPAFYANRRYDYAEVLPWDHLNLGVSKDFLRQEMELALNGQQTPACRWGKCAGCGLCPAFGVVPEIIAPEANEITAGNLEVINGRF
jgi:radical SAM family uncharacterized protein